MTQESFDFMVNEKKRCSKCRGEKDTRYFYRHLTNKDGLGTVCKSCYSERENLKNRLKAGFANLKTDYCECCGKIDAKIYLDHCHDYKVFRGFICNSCNVKLGHMGDTYESLLENDAEDFYIEYMRLAAYRRGEVV